MDNIRGKVVVVTGAARGIGRATAEALLARGARVVIGDRDVAVDAQRAASVPAPLGDDDRAADRHRRGRRGARV